MFRNATATLAERLKRQMTPPAEADGVIEGTRALRSCGPPKGGRPTSSQQIPAVDVDPSPTGETDHPLLDFALIVGRVRPTDANQQRRQAKRLVIR